MSLTKGNTTQQQWITWLITTLREAAWAPLSVVLFYGIGLALDWYDIYPPLDIPSHLMGGVTITYFYRAAIRNAQKYLGDIPHPVQTLFAFTATGTTVVLWEFYENLSDYFLHTQHVFGLNDTLKDMFIGLLGALLLSIFYRKR
jgi:hypothetical protein